jgi:hypothetical protein
MERPNMRAILDRIKPATYRESVKEIFLKKMRVILKLMALQYSSEEPTLENAFGYLGQAQARLAMLEEVQEFLQRVLDSRIPVWPQELWDLRELSKQQVATCTQLVKAILFKLDKEQQESKNLPQVIEMKW